MNPPATSTAEPVPAAVDVARVAAPTRRGREMCQRLLDAARTVFDERGYSETRVSDITTTAGTAQGNFYRHFTNKNDILLAVLADPLDELLEMANPPFVPGAAPSLDELIAWNTDYFIVYRRHAAIYKVMREAAAAGAEASFAGLWKLQRQRFVDRVHEWLEALYSHGQLRNPPADRTLMAESLLSMRENLSYVHVALAGAPVSDERIAALGEMVGLLWFRCLDLASAQRSGRRRA